MKLSDREWTVLAVLWDAGGAALGEVTRALETETGWSRNTVLTYLTRMETKGLAQARDSFLQNVYRGAAGDLIAAFLKEKPISPEEREELRRLLDEMEV